MLQVAKSKGSKGPKVGTEVQFGGLQGVFLVINVEPERITCLWVRNINNKP